ncbi:Phospholipase C [Chromobacterium violaceum]|uniref:phospholipase C n=1 Tax=Chromobacterium violaceum TaxID=536 RepID=A0A3S4IKA8_CHRVL|nr:Phospholipase C [Chromobacterium violaceum]
MSEHDTPETVPETAPQDPSRRRLFEGLAAIGAATVLPAVASEAADAAPAARGSLDDKLRHHVKNVVVIYLENRSFNNLYGNFPGVRYPLSKAPAEACVQLDRDGARLKSLPKIWGGMVQRGQTVGGKYYLIEEDKIQNLPNGPFPLKDTDGEPLPEGVITRDLWHLFYQNQMQINGGRNDQFVAWADSGALVMGYYNETAKNLNQWKIAQQYTLCDNFFMAAFGGSYLNHQFLISAARRNTSTPRTPPRPKRSRCWRMAPRATG